MRILEAPEMARHGDIDSTERLVFSLAEEIRSHYGVVEPLTWIDVEHHLERMLELAKRRRAFGNARWSGANLSARRVVLLVAGMRESACCIRVGNALKDVAGVQEVSVDLYRATCEVEFAPPCVPESLICAISSAGYGATLCETRAPSQETKEVHGATGHV